MFVSPQLIGSSVSFPTLSLKKQTSKWIKWMIPIDETLAMGCFSINHQRMLLAQLKPFC
jgi:hypothetical protein